MGKVRANPRTGVRSNPKRISKKRDSAYENDVANVKMSNQESVGTRTTQKVGSGTSLKISWTNEEIALLSEAVELFGQDWNKVTAHVKTRSINACKQRVYLLNKSANATADFG